MMLRLRINYQTINVVQVYAQSEAIPKLPKKLNNDDDGRLKCQGM